MRMRASAVLAAVAGWLLTAGMAAAQDAAFPPSLERDSLLAWLQRETDIAPERVVAVTSQALTSVVSTFPATAEQGPRVVVRAEALSEEVYGRTGALSWHVSLSADCAGRRVRLGETTGYPQRNLLGERRQLRAAETEWRVPERGTALDNAWRAACETGFKGPFGNKTLMVAMETQAATAPATTAPPVAQAAAAPAHKPEAPRRAEPKVAVAASAPAKAAGPVAQIGATPSDADARGLLNALGSRLEGRKAWVEKADVGGRTWYRAMVGGFADPGEANGFCAGLKAAGKGCFVRLASR